MPIVGTPLNAAAAKKGLTASEVRVFLRDYSGKNPLLADVEFSDSEISIAVSMAVEQANVIGRPTTYTVSSFPNSYVLKLGAVSYLLKSEAFRQVRNEATYQDGNIQPIGVDNKQQSYLGIAGMLTQEFVQLVTSIKVAANMSTSRGVGSPLKRFK